MTKELIKGLFWIGAGLIILYLTPLDKLPEFFGLETAGEFNDILSPGIALIGIVLIYGSFLKQAEANNNQASSNNAQLYANNNQANKNAYEILNDQLKELIMNFKELEFEEDLDLLKTPEEIHKSKDLEETSFYKRKNALDYFIIGIEKYGSKYDAVSVDFEDDLTRLTYSFIFFLDELKSSSLEETYKIYLLRRLLLFYETSLQFHIEQISTIPHETYSDIVEVANLLISKMKEVEDKLEPYIEKLLS